MIAIVWYATTSAFPTICRCPQPPNRTHQLRSFTCSTTRRLAFGRSAARRDGGWRSRCAPCRRSLRAWGVAGVAQGPVVIAALAREVGAEASTGTKSHRRRTGLLKMRCCGAGEIGIVTHRFPGDLLAKIRNKENRGLRVFTPFWRRVQALGDPPSHACAEAVERPGQPRKRRAGRLEARTGQARLGRRAARHLAAGRGGGAGTAQGVPRRRHCRLFR